MENCITHINTSGVGNHFCKFQLFKQPKRAHKLANKTSLQIEVDACDVPAIFSSIGLNNSTLITNVLNLLKFYVTHTNFVESTCIKTLIGCFYSKKSFNLQIKIVKFECKSEMFNNKNNCATTNFYLYLIFVICCFSLNFYYSDIVMFLP